MTTFNLDQHVGGVGQVFKAALTGGAIAAVINVIIFFVFQALGASYVVEGAPQNPTVVAAAVSSLLPAVLAAGFLLVLARFVPDSALKIFTGVSVILLLLSFGGVMGAQDTMTLVSLSLMHIVAGVVIIWSLVTSGTAA